MIEPIEFETKRLHLQQWIARDLEPFAALNADSRVMAFFPYPLARISNDAIADRCQLLITERGWVFWATEIKETRQFIGFVGLHIPDSQLPFSPCVEIGWRLAYPYWRKGYATEAARAVLQVGFEMLNLSEIVSFTALYNLRSRVVMERLGMHETAETFEHPHIE